MKLCITDQVIVSVSVLTGSVSH